MKIVDYKTKIFVLFMTCLSLFLIAGCGDSGGGGDGDSKPVISLSASTLNFTAEVGGTNPESQTVTMSNSGGGLLQYTASTETAWLDGYSVDNSSNNATITVIVDITGLSAGSYTGTITISAPEAASKTITVNLTVTDGSSNPVISLSTSTLSFTAEVGGTNPQDQTVTVSNGGEGLLVWTPSTETAWISGFINNNSTNETTLTVSVDITGLSAGSYTGTITISAPGAASKTITVNLTVTNGTATKGSISGTVLVGASFSQKPKLANTKDSKTKPKSSKPDFVPGELIVKFKKTITIAEGVAKLIDEFGEYGITKKSEISVINAAVLRIEIYDLYKRGELSRDEAQKRTIEFIEAVNNHAVVEYAEPNYISSIQTTEPNDQFYSKQWHYRMINLPYAWDITTGSSSVIVAVLDDGIRFYHPDLADNLLNTGYDFVSDPQNAGDGDGIDPDPTAPQGSVYHGTHVAGTIAAVSNNRIGVAGVAWDVKIMPVRVLGKTGGTDDEIMQGMLYAAGLLNDSGTIPPQKADIINMSLGGEGSSLGVQDVVNQVVAQGVTVIAAAGNEATEGNPVEYPCAYENVICVGAVNPYIQRASYSNYNAYVDVVAPGGEGEDGSSQNVFSLTWNDFFDFPTYISWQGTSMATPHVSGVAALMRSVDPNLTPAQIESILTSTAWDIGSAGRDDEYGYGLVNAYLAVLTANGGTPSGPILYAQPDLFYLTSSNTQESVSIQNSGGGSITISEVTYGEVTGSNWLSVSLDQTTVPAALTVTADPTGLSNNIFAGTITIKTDAGDQEIDVLLDNRSTPDIGTVFVQLLDSSEEVVDQTTTSSALGYAYSFTDIDPGQYYVVAGVDTDGSGEAGDQWGEYMGEFPLLGNASAITVSAGFTTSDIDFGLSNISDMIWFDGNGLGPIDGAILVRVVDSTGAPIEGAKVYIGDGNSFSGTTNFFGRATITGSFSGAQTVTATASGYNTSTYWQTNASYLTFILGEISPTTVTLDVTITDLLSGEFGEVYVTDNAIQTFTYSGTDPTLTFNVPKDKPFTVSAIVHDASDTLSGFAYTISEGIDTALILTLQISSPLNWHPMVGSITLPSGNFDPTAMPINYNAYGYAYLGLFQDLLWTGFQSISDPSLWQIEVAEIADSDLNTIIAIAGNAIGEGSAAFTPTLPFSQLPDNATAVLIDVPALTSPADNTTTSSTTPTFSWSNTFTPSLQILSVTSPTSGWEWEVIVPNTLSSITLPNIPAGGLTAGTTYDWDVMNDVVSDFDYNDFDMQLVEQTRSDFSWSETRSFITP